MKKFICILIVSLLWSMSCNSKIEVAFSPSLDCENKIIYNIDSAKSSIDIVVYAINNDNIVNSLKRAYDRGIKIRVLTDKKQAAKNSKFYDLYQYGINTRVHTYFTLEHNKFAIYDNKIVSTGSYNWTNPASSKNSENCLFIEKNNHTLDSYIKRFSYLWKKNLKSKSDKWVIKKFET